MTRTRTRRTEPPLVGWLRRKTPNTDRTISSYFRDKQESITDSPPGKWGALTIDKAWSDNAMWRDRLAGGDGIRTWQNYVPLGFQVPTNNNFLDPIPGSPSDGEAATALLAGTNPSRPVVSIPNFVNELREIPRLLKSEGDTLLKRAAHTNLSFQFGWAPLISDLTKLMQFGAQVNKRTRELNALFESGLRRKRILFRGTHEVGRSVTVQSDNAIQNYRMHTVTREVVWGYVVWTPSVPTPQSSDEMRKLATKAVLGLTIDPSVAWEALPWSWLIDYFTNVGDFLAAHRNVVGATHGPVYIMRHTRAETLCSPNYGDAQAEAPTFNRYRERKTRRASNPSIKAQMSYLSGRQLSILGSIGVTRRMNRGLVD